MDSVSHHSWVSLCGVLGLGFLLLTSLAHTGEKREIMDLNALKAQVAEFQQCFDKNPSDDKALRAVGIVYYAATLKDSRAMPIKENHYER